MGLGAGYFAFGYCQGFHYNLKLSQKENMDIALAMTLSKQEELRKQYGRV